MRLEKYTHISNKLYWTLNIGGWIAYLGIILPYYLSPKLQNWLDVLGGLTMPISGILTSFPMRMIYRKINYKNKSILHLMRLVVLISIPSAIIWYAIDYSFTISIYSYEKISTNYTFARQLLWITEQIPVMLAWGALYFVIKIWYDWQDEKIASERANTLAQKANLQMLRYQLNPHFFFNALSSLRALTRTDSASAEKMITKISEFLRYSLIGEDCKEVPLLKEVEVIKHYLDIEKVRFGERLHIEYDIDELAEDYPVPCFILNPLVENAVKHGMNSIDEPLTISISAEVSRDDTLHINIKNNGAWKEQKEDSSKYSSGKGLANVQQRLKLLYPTNHTFTIEKDKNFVKILISIKH